MTSCGSDESDIVDDTTSPLPESGISRYFYESGPPTNTYIELEFEDPDFISKRYYFGMPDSRFYNLYSYDSEGKLTGADFYNNAGEFESPVYKIEYDGTRLKKVLLFSMGPDDPIEIEVTYSGNEISFLKTDDGRVASMLFDGDRLVATSHEAMPEFFKTTELIYDDSKIVVYKIPKPNSSEPFLLLGSGWHVFEPEYNARATMTKPEILVVNPTNTEIDVTLNLVLSSVAGNKQTMTVSINGEKLDVIYVPTVATDIHLENLTLKPGINAITLDADKFILVEEKSVSFKVESISIIN